MGMNISREDAVSAIGPVRMQLLLDCINEAWNVYNARFRPHIPFSTIRGVASDVNELTVQQVRERFVGVTGATVRDNTTGGRFLLQIDHKLILFFKKLTDDFHTSNHDTETSLAFDRQEETVADYPEMPRVVVGYKLADSGTAMSGKYLAFCVGKENIWYHDIESGEQSIELQFPTSPRSPADQESDDLQQRRDRNRRNQATDNTPVDDGRSDPE